VLLGDVAKGEVPLPLHLPKAIEVFYASENAHDADALGECFAPDAFVADERRTMRGISAIKAWRLETEKKYQHKVEPIGIAERDGKTIVTSKLSGNFPGSPITVDFVFKLESGKIASLEIR